MTNIPENVQIHFIKDIMYADITNDDKCKLIHGLLNDNEYIDPDILTTKSERANNLLTVLNILRQKYL